MPLDLAKLQRGRWSLQESNSKSNAALLLPLKRTLAIALAKIVLEKKFVKLQTSDLGNVDRQSVKFCLCLFFAL